ncbi:MAG: response regulator [Spirochaetes bacterium]|nr:response regulator [Spirochaetota bacterium]
MTAMEQFKTIPLPDQAIDQSGIIMIVGDESINCMAVHEILESKGCRIVGTENGEQAADVINQEPPDVVILDIMMSGIDGFAVCRKLKNNPQTAHIPVLMIAAFSDRKVRLAGIEAGVNDFITTPIDVQDVILRVRNALYTKHLSDQVRNDYKKFQELEHMQDNLTYMIIHDLKQPLTAISGYLELLIMELGDDIEQKQKEFIDLISAATNSSIDMFNNLLDVYRFRERKIPLQTRTFDIKTLVNTAFKKLKPILGKQKYSIHVSSGSSIAVFDPALIERVLVNLVGNAAKFTKQNGEINVIITRIKSGIKVTISDNGMSIPFEYQEKIFEKFGQVEISQLKERRSIGLSLTFCKIVVEAHGGQIGVESIPGAGISFWFILPG